MPVPTRRIDAAIVYLCYLFADGCIRGLLYTVLAVYFVLRVSMDPLQLVLIGTVLEASIFLFEIPTGIVADVYSRKLSIVIGQTLFGIAYVVQASVPLFIPIALAEVVRAVGETFLSGAVQAWVGGELAPERLAGLLVRGVQLRRVGRLLGIVASALLANIALELPLLIGAVLALVVAVALAVAMPERGFVPSDRAANFLSAARQGFNALASSRALALLLALAMVAGAASEGVDRLWEAHLLADFQIPGVGDLSPVTWFGVLEAGGLIIGIGALQLVSRVQATEFGRITQLTALAILARSAAIAVFALTSSWPVAILARWTHVGLSGVTGPLLDAWIVRNTPAGVRATVFSTLGQGDALGQAFGGPLLGAIGTSVSLRAAIVGSALLMLPGIGLLHLARRTEGDRTRREIVSMQ